MNLKKRQSRARSKAKALRCGTYRPTQFGHAGQGKKVLALRMKAHATGASGLSLDLVTNPDQRTV